MKNIQICFYSVIILCLLPCAVVSETLKPIPCNISNQLLEERIRALYSEHIKNYFDPKDSRLRSPDKYKKVIKIGSDLEAELLRDRRCLEENPGNLCAINSDLLLAAQDFEESGSVKEVTIQRQSEDILISLSFQFASARMVGPGKEAVVLKFSCEDNELVWSDVLYKSGRSLLKGLKEELDNLGVK